MPCLLGKKANQDKQRKTGPVSLRYPKSRTRMSLKRNYVLSQNNNKDWTVVLPVLARFDTLYLLHMLKTFTNGAQMPGTGTQIKKQSTTRDFT
jgi:hypothetical protein